MQEKKSILIVDDSETVRDLLSTILKSNSFDVVEALSGNDALRKLNGYKPHMVITDIDMPDMNGVELIRNLKSKAGCEHIPVIVLSSLTSEVVGLNERELDVAEWI